MAAGSQHVAVRRWEFLDALRGVAVLAVLTQHVGEQVSSSYRSFTSHWLQVGQAGVTVFFLVSGFIVPVSLERHGSLRGFWTSRVCRLYPLYWLSLVAAVVLWQADRFDVPGDVAAHPALGVAANATMLQGFAGVGNVIELYWSLLFEMAFYLALSVLFAMRLQRRSVEVALGAMAAAVAGTVLLPVVTGHDAPVGSFNLATMATGTVLYRWHAGDVARRTAAIVVAAAVACFTVALAVRLVGAPALPGGTRSFVPMELAWLSAYSVFLLGLAARDRRLPAVLLRLGVVSYSVYLVHPLVLALVEPTGWARALAAVAVVIGVSALTYRLVEQPAIRWGRARTAA